jgi:hypothetical protein
MYYQPLAPSLVGEPAGERKWSPRRCGDGHPERLLGRSVQWNGGWPTRFHRAHSNTRPGGVYTATRSRDDAPGSTASGACASCTSDVPDLAGTRCTFDTGSIAGIGGTSDTPDLLMLDRREKQSYGLPLGGGSEHVPA